MGRKDKRKNLTPKKCETQISPEYKKTKFSNRFAPLNTEAEEQLDMASDTSIDFPV